MTPITSNKLALESGGLYRVADITARGKFSKTHLYNLIARGQFPDADLRGGPRFTRWKAASVDAWFADPAGWMARVKGEAVKAERDSTHQ